MYRFLSLLKNIRLGWKKLERDERSSLFGRCVGDEKKCDDVVTECFDVNVDERQVWTDAVDDLVQNAQILVNSKLH